MSHILCVVPYTRLCAVPVTSIQDYSIFYQCVVHCRSYSWNILVSPQFMELF